MRRQHSRDSSQLPLETAQLIVEVRVMIVDAGRMSIVTASNNSSLSAYSRYLLLHAHGSKRRTVTQCQLQDVRAVVPAGVPLGQAVGNLPTRTAEQLHVRHMPCQQRIQLCSQQPRIRLRFYMSTA